MLRPYLAMLLLFIVMPVVSAQLDISRVRLTTESGTYDVRPGETLRANFRIDNTGEQQLKDIRVSVVFLEEGRLALHDERDRKVNLTTQISILRPGASADRELSFRLPYIAEHNTKYVMEIIARGFSGNRTLVQAVNTEDSFTVVKRPHELIFELVAVNPPTLQCGREGSISFIVRNIGNDNEESVVFTAVREELGISVRDIFSVSADYKKNNTYVKKLNFRLLGNVRPATYLIAVSVDYDKGFHITQDVPLAVTCPSYVPQREPERLPQEPEPEPKEPKTPPRSNTTESVPESPPETALRLPQEKNKMALFAAIGGGVLIALSLLIFAFWRLRKIRGILR